MATRIRPLTLAVAVATAIVVLGIGFLVVGSSKDNSKPASGPTPAAQAAAAAKAIVPQVPANVGPEGVPLLGGPALGPASSPAKGKSRGGVPCGSKEQLAYHVHARLTLFVHGKPRSVPLGIGIGAPVKTTDTGSGRFASGGSCFSFLHTHAPDGVIHIEAPAQVSFRLGQFFDIWRQRLDRTHLGRFHGRVTAYVNGSRWKGDPRAIPLRTHAEIQLSIGKTIVPTPVAWPPGL